MRYLRLVVAAGLMLVGVRVKAEDGKIVFDSLHCGNCHRADTGRTNPSLEEIARSYQGKVDQLLRYLRGEAESVVNPEKGKMMERYIEKTAALSDAERKALADFILSHKE